MRRTEPAEQAGPTQPAVTAGTADPAEVPLGRVRATAVTAALLAGTLLAPLNSSIVAVGLDAVRRDFAIGFAEVSWLVTGFYLTACVAMPVAGRLADVYGPRSVFAAGMTVASAASVAAPFVPTIELLVACRCLLALGVSASFPCLMVTLRRFGTPGRLSAVAVVNTTAGAIGPVVGGPAVAWLGWPAVFWVNLPLTCAALVVALVLLPGRPPWAGRGPRRMPDLLGGLLFAGGLVLLLRAVLMHPVDVPSGLAALGVLGAFVAWELRVRTPFVDVRALRAAPGMLAVLAGFVLFNLAYYAAFYGLPQWFQGPLGLGPAQAGLLLFPLAASSVLATVGGARLLGPLSPLRLGLLALGLLLVGAVAVALLRPGSPIWLVVMVAALLGVPYGLGNLGMQQLMYDRSPPQLAGLSGGLFQSARYVGAILAVGALGTLTPAAGDDAAPDVTGLGVAMAVIAVLGAVVLGTAARRHPAGPGTPR
ncbi:MFS transporter [Pseudonocardia sp. NPDC046786]|uniref:MFS transporter n=1 Tax=Pseudonocardia sp. NPDC046786 TaxID=3155471 RepID=UPI00340C733F